MCVCVCAPIYMGFPDSSASRVRKIPWRRDRLPTPVFLGFPGGSEGKESARSVRDLGSIPGLGRSPGEGNGNPLQYSCLENPMDGGAWWAIVHRVTKSWTRLSDFTFTFIYIYASWVAQLVKNLPAMWETWV